ncbi:hypothetical protein CRENBAI_001668, partial [Crenichthys baileyi]
MLPACLRSGFLHSTDRNRMIPPTMELADSRQESARDLAPAGPGSGRGAVDLFTFLSREVEKTLRRSAGLSHSGPALKPSPSSRRKKRRRGAPSCSAGEEVVSLPADVRAAAGRPASSPATAPSPRLAAAPPMPSSLTPARCSEATPEELEERIRFVAQQIKTFRETSLMYSSPELMERIGAVHARTPGSCAAAEQPTPGLQGAAAAAEQPTPGLQGAAAAAEQPTPGLQGAAAAAEQPTPGLQGAAAAAEQPTAGPEHLLSFLCGVLTELKPDTHHDTPQPDSARSDTPQPDTPQHDTGLTRSLPQPPPHAAEDVGLGDASAPAPATEGLGDASAPAHATRVSATPQSRPRPPRVSATPQLLLHATEGPADASAFLT